MSEKTLFSSNKYFSHPDKLLSEHLSNVANNARRLTRLKNIDLSEFFPSVKLDEIAYLIGAAHDFGKFTNYFQNYLLEENQTKKTRLKNKRETNHSFFSAVFAFALIKEYLDINGLIENGYNNYIPIISFLVVKKHHGDLRDALTDVIIKEKNADINENDADVFRKQFSAINIEDAQQIYDALLSEVGFKFNLYKIEETLSDLKNINFANKPLVRALRRKSELIFYFALIFFYSVLLDSDKTDAAELVIFKPHNLSVDIIDNYKKRKFGSNPTGINLTREEIYKEVIEKVNGVNLDKEKIFSLNVPTGSGKTLTSFSFALKLRERIEREKNYSPKIIYSLPFLSIIEQNYDVINEALNNPTPDVLLKHHHLSDVFYETASDDFRYAGEDVGKNLLLIEGWNADVIFTTFAQFFHSFITNKNRAARKFHNIVNSIVIFDEIQAIPHEYWLLLNKTIGFFAKYFGTYFIVMTATKPLIFDETIELVENKEKYFSNLNRYELLIDAKEKSLDDFVEDVSLEIASNENSDFLIVLNTINASIKVYNALKEAFAEQSEIYYLSTNIIPKERIERIEKVKKQNGKRKIIVSTQMIEAGVDIDVDVVIRDFAPLDSVNQTAGRCNRSFSKSKGKVTLVNLFEENEETGRKYFPKKIYDSFLLSKSNDVLENVSQLSEKDFLQFTDEYFAKVKSGISNEKSRQILEVAETLAFSEIEKFKLIETTYPTIDIFIELDETARKIWEQYQNIIHDKNLNGFKKRNEFLRIRKPFNDYIISVPKSYAVNFEEGIVNNVSFEELKIFYDFETGFKRKNNNTGIVSY